MPSSTHGRSTIRSTRAGRSARQVAGWASAQTTTIATGQAIPAKRVTEEDATGEGHPGQRPADPRPEPARGRLGPHQVDRDGEDEERLGGLLEGRLGEVGGGHVGDRDKGRADHPAPGGDLAQRPERGERR